MIGRIVAWFRRWYHIERWHTDCGWVTFCDAPPGKPCLAPEDTALWDRLVGRDK